MMKKAVLLLVVALVAAPAMAEVTITGYDEDETTGPGLTGVIEYEADGNLPRAFALDITVSGGAVITDVCEVDPNFYIHPGTFSVDEQGIVSGEPVAPNSYPGTLSGLNSSGITVEMGSLYVGGPNAPETSSVLLKLVVDKGCKVTVALNTIRAGIVMEDPDEDADDNLPINFDINDVPAGCLCYGDVTGDGKVSIADLSSTVAYLNPAYKFSTPPFTGPVDNLCRDVTGDGKISIADLSNIVGYLNPAYKFSTPPFTGPCKPAP